MPAVNCWWRRKRWSAPKMKLELPALLETGQSVFGPLPPFAAGCVPASRVAGGPGHVLRPTLAGHRVGPAGVARSTPWGRAQVVATANGACARTPCHLPGHPGGMPRRGTPPTDAAGRWWCPRARAPFAVAPTLAGHSGVDAAAHRTMRRSPASVGRRTGAPPPPWGHNGGMPTLSGQTPSDLHRTSRRAWPFHASRKAPGAMEH
jgi:hypothetical protein